MIMIIIYMTPVSPSPPPPPTCCVHHLLNVVLNLLFMHLGLLFCLDMTMQRCPVVVVVVVVVVLILSLLFFFSPVFLISPDIHLSDVHLSDIHLSDQLGSEHKLTH